MGDSNRTARAVKSGTDSGDEGRASPVRENLPRLVSALYRLDLSIHLVRMSTSTRGAGRVEGQSRNEYTRPRLEYVSIIKMSRFRTRRRMTQPVADRVAVLSLSAILCQTGRPQSQSMAKLRFAAF